VPGHYNRDPQMFVSYQRESQTPDAFAAWQARWVDGVRDRDGYLALLGQARLAGLALKTHAISESVDHGY
jgi:glutaconate CoA-transferase subunit A